MPPISKISDKITLEVTFIAGANQPANVLNILGPKGEFITGKGAEKFGSGTIGKFTVFKVSKDLNIQFKK